MPNPERRPTHSLFCSAGLALALVTLMFASHARLAGNLVERPLITARRAIVTSLHPLSSMAGMKVLMAGGNAFDAAVATAVATTVVDPKNSTIGGQGFATVYGARTGEVKALNFFGPAPRAATVERLDGTDYSEGYLSTPVPSNLRGYQALLEEYGTMSWSRILEPAIELAEEGFVISAEDARLLNEFGDRLSPYPSSRSVFFPDGRLPKAGDVFRQPDLARTLRHIARDGPDVFYTGEIARRIADFFQDHGGLLSFDDLSSYQPQWVQPISTTYRGYRFYTQPPNSSAAALLLQLNLLEGFEVTQLGHNSPAHLHLLGEIQRLAIADRNTYIADPDFSTIPLIELLSKEYAATRRKALRLGRTLPAISAGQPRKSQGENTTHLTVVDAAGNMVALTQTLGRWYGSGVVAADTGVLFSNQMRHLHLEGPSRLAPGKRPRSNQSPTIVLKDGAPFMAIGTPGSDAIWQRMTQVISNIVDFGMDIQSAISAPRIIYGGFQETGVELPPIFKVENRIPAETVAALRKMGFTVDVVAEDEGRLNGVLRDPRTGFLHGGADPRADVYAIGW